MTLDWVQFCDLALMGASPDRFVVGGRVMVKSGKGNGGTQSRWALWRYFY